ncbi:HAD-like domain-containing protein [Radiomyces spectabilis]|uniref:HAD-like domain-containing protein n=1 Tax=Radiomyces spectabilis TaxID=64574 RepID=UPI00221F9AD5|nr:HAD-like domain-containing protein [Radiomyces spectabilis]KAI8375954.1 HAD-like domain-containing protein [Radiomyces spectabilis]
MATNKVKGLLIDLSGTIHIESKAIPGAVEAVKRLKASKIPFRFATNTTKISSRRLVEQLNQLGFDVEEREIFTSLSACRDLIVSRNLRPMLLMADKAMDEFESVNTENPNAVVIGLAPSKFNYDTMNQAFRLLMKTDTPEPVPLIAVHKAKYLADKDEQLSMGPGGFVQALEFATGKTATVVGKPSESFFHMALKQIGMEESPHNVAMIGDDVDSDLGGAAEALGLHRFLVRTGKFRPEDEARFKGDNTRVFDSVVEAIDAVIAQY